jgi:hypothetical protein
MLCMYQKGQRRQLQANPTLMMQWRTTGNTADPTDRLTLLLAAVGPAVTSSSAGNSTASADPGFRRRMNTASAARGPRRKA